MDKRDMLIKFTGYMLIPSKDIPDDRGSVDVWLLNFIESTIENGPESDDIYENLALSWENVEDNEEECALYERNSFKDTLSQP